MATDLRRLAERAASTADPVPAVATTRSVVDKAVEVHGNEDLSVPIKAARGGKQE